ncbi:MAG: gliding motility-associated C-terminal domain-containing protein [Ferruginibacter sp.]
MSTRKPLRNILLSIACLAISFSIKSQCIVPSGSLVYHEDFETNNGAWFSGGNANDWAWGTPVKSVITGASIGKKCWIVGGLTGNSYGNGEASWIQSPCFDFSALQYPHIQFDIFWEMERRFDGANLQYSTNNGSSWINVGSSADVGNCLNTNWFNYANITYLAAVSQVKEGWSGNIQTTSGSCQGGFGSGGWVTAQKSMPYLAGKTNVIFRFTFGAGTVCNNFNGFAVDNITVGETPPNNAAFSFTCLPNNTVNFSNTSAYCPQVFDWNFGDANSGINNISNVQNPTHRFSAPGTYDVVFKVSGPFNAPSTITRKVTILDANATIVTPLNCFGNNNGAVTVAVTGTTAPLTYTWNTNPVQTTQTATNLVAGAYNVDVTAPGACAASSLVQLTQPVVLSHVTSVIQPGCKATTGSISIVESGGTVPYTYTWTPMVSTSATASGLAHGDYKIEITDKNLCTDNISINIAAPVIPIVKITSHKDVSCKGGNNGTATATIVAALPGAVSYSWNTNPIQQTATATGLSAGSYTVIMMDINGCTSTDIVIIKEPVLQFSVTTKITGTTCGKANGNILLTTSGGIAPFTYLWAPAVSNNNNSGNINAGNYRVTVTDNGGCAVTIVDMNVINTSTPAIPFLGNDTVICANQPVIVKPGNFATYLWQDNSSLPHFNVTQTGTYTVSVSNTNGCTGKDTINVEVRQDCGDVFFPTSFSPNGDSKNDLFGPLGNVDLISNYKLSIYNRYGELVFTTNNPATKWDGSFKGSKIAVASYVWYANYTFKGVVKRSQYGTVTVIK